MWDSDGEGGLNGQNPPHKQPRHGARPPAPPPLTGPAARWLWPRPAASLSANQRRPPLPRALPDGDSPQPERGRPAGSSRESGWQSRESGEAPLPRPPPPPRPPAALRPAALPPPTPPPAAAAGSVSRWAVGREGKGEEGGGRSALRTERCLSAIAAEEEGEGSAATGARGLRRRLAPRRRFPSRCPPRPDPARPGLPALRAAPAAAVRSEGRQRPPPPGPRPRSRGLPPRRASPGAPPDGRRRRRRARRCRT